MVGELVMTEDSVGNVGGLRSSLRGDRMKWRRWLFRVLFWYSCAQRTGGAIESSSGITQIKNLFRCVREYNVPIRNMEGDGESQ